MVRAPAASCKPCVLNCKATAAPSTCTDRDKYRGEGSWAEILRFAQDDTCRVAVTLHKRATWAEILSEAKDDIGHIMIDGGRGGLLRYLAWGTGNALVLLPVNIEQGKQLWRP